MKFVRYGDKGKERPGVLDPLNRIRDISHLVTEKLGEQLQTTVAYDPKKSR